MYLYSTSTPVAILPSTSSATRLVSSPSTHRQSETPDSPSSPSAASSDSPSASIASSSSVSASVSTSNVGSATTQATDPAISRGSSLRSPSPSQAASSSSTRRQGYEEGGEEASITSLSSQKTATVSAKNDNKASCMASASTADGAVARSQSLDQSLIHRSCSQYESESEADIESESESQSESEVESGSGSESRSQPRQAPKFHHNPSSSLLLDGSSASDPIPIPLAPIPKPHNHVVKIRDLSHVRGLVRAELLTGTPSEETENVRYDISAMPVEDVIEMVAALLTKITSTNDQNHHEPTQRGVSYSDSPSCLSSVTTSVLAFHGKNIPAITILSYLSRVHRYCPTTYEVFLSLLVYFERMTECVNNQAVRSEKERRFTTNPAKECSPAELKPPSTVAGPPHQENTGFNSSSCSDPTDDQEKCDAVSAARSPSDDGDDAACSVKSSSDSASVGTKLSASTLSGSPAAAASSTYFVVDSYNIHRLIIAGVTCASKFFSDVFYTNSRYAKVGGLPLAELNHLELQFLLLNDFRLFIPAENLEAYATMLVEFYAREVVSQLAHIDGE
ncbi:PHO85 cyclin-7 [Ceratocystis fimbriata CBS 114723]|uniref:PHO85 cyclin-7 n=1 Tax=Ceratocystis fimbriata CBS 114723 TaxID=1035309 RepID=A0A2C5WUE3_9PEZI|nr:PHO85 cyclin-7 [Ceratocystis fimbriata CBS 114723]